ncbi:hypothetical protein [Pyrobaculum sp.]|uniref:hypothetical protein n=1 Tax=Pyrobaculum sp. TaxID=2004705 RepID=UPI003D0BDC92
MGFQRHCLPGVCYLAESGRYRVQEDLVASVGLHSTEASLALDVARRLEGAWGRHVARFAASALARWLTRRGYSVAFTRFRNILLPGVRITASTGDRVGRLLRSAAAYLAGVAEATGARCGGVEVFMEEPDDLGVVGSARAAAGCVEIAARNSREGLVLYVGVRPGVKALYNSVLESLDGAGPARVVVGNHVVVGRFVTYWRLVLRRGKGAAAASVRGPLVVFDSFEVRHRQHGKLAVVLKTPYAVVEFSTTHVSREHAAVFNATRLSME